MSCPIRIAGLADTDALWFTLAAQTAAEAHWPGGMPKIVSKNLEALRKAADEFAHLAGLVGGILYCEGAEGVETEGCDVTLVFEDEDDEDTGDDDGTW